MDAIVIGTLDRVFAIEWRLAVGFEPFAWHGSANIAIPEIPPYS
jgi:hypothetical protein